jgi:ubiquinone/menaquinone biosynthesis C-methylase UbiE
MLRKCVQVKSNLTESLKRYDSEKRDPDYNDLLSKQNEGFDMRWCYEVKEVDRRLSYSLVQKSSLVCDIGGAQGVDAFAFAEKGASVINIDINGYALRVGNRHAHELKLNSTLSFVKASATNMPFRKGIFDLATCFSTLDHLPNKKSAYQAISEFSRIVRGSGYVAITVPNNLFLIGTISMRVKNLTDSEAFFEQRFTPKELFLALSKYSLKPIIVDSEFPKTVTPEILIFHFPKLFRRIPGILYLLSLGAKILAKTSRTNAARLFGARMGYLSMKV